MIDSHCHLDLPKLFSSADAVLARAKVSGITRILIPGTSPQGWQRQQALLANAPPDLALDIAFGIHPYFLEHNDLDGALKTLESLLAHTSHVVAIGETGLDTTISCPIDIQQRALAAHLSLAQQYSLPVILHHRKSHHLLVGALKHSQFKGSGVIHAFSGSIEVAMQYLERGFYLGVGGTITYPRGAKTRRTLKALFHEYSHRLLLETDAPDMPMYGRQGMTNEPAYLSDVVNSLSEHLGMAREEVIALTSNNYHTLFHV